MKSFPIHTLTSVVGAVGPMSAARSVVSEANVPGILAVVAEKSKGLVAETIPRATIQGAKWIAANPGTAAACGAAGVGLVLIVTPGLVAAPALGAVGFGAEGIVGGMFSSPSL